jgi:hypothetical protein
MSRIEFLIVSIILIISGVSLVIQVSSIPNRDKYNLKRKPYNGTVAHFTKKINLMQVKYDNMNQLYHRNSEKIESLAKDVESIKSEPVSKVLNDICNPNINKKELLEWLSIPTQLHNTIAPALPSLECITDKKVYDVFMFSHELDILEIRLFELWDVVDQFHIIENTFDFHGRQQQPVLYDTKRMARFERFKSKMFFHINDGSFGVRKGVDWSFEEHSTSFAVTIANSLDGIVIFGHADEIPLRTAVQKLKACDVKLPLNFASWMPLGNVKDKFRSDFPARGYPYSIGEPSAAYGKDIIGLSRGKYNNVLFGGFHATNYCYMPASLYKEMTATEYTYEKSESSVDCVGKYLTKCLSMLDSRKKLVQPSDRLKLPWIIDQNRDAYASWFGKVDSRLLKTVNTDRRRD